MRQSEPRGQGGDRDPGGLQFSLNRKTPLKTSEKREKLMFLKAGAVLSGTVSLAHTKP
jgi:hypothetical protein